jgi:hypothetical protein
MISKWARYEKKSEKPMFDQDNRQKRMFRCAAASALRSIALVAALFGTVTFAVQLSTAQTKDDFI